MGNLMSNCAIPINVNSKKAIIRSWYLLFLAVAGSWAMCIGDTTLNRPKFVFIIPYFCYLFNIFFVFFLRKEIRTHDLWMLSIPIIGFLIFNLNVYNRESYSPNALFFFNLLVFALTDDSEKHYGFLLLRKLFVVTSCLGIIAYTSYIIGLGLPYSIVPYYTEADNACYIDYGFSYIVERLNVIRLCGYVNEPGLFGTLIALILISDRYDLQKKGNIIMFVAALLTLSSAFIIISLIYFFIRYMKSVKMILVLFSVIGVLLYYLFVIGIESDSVNAMTVSRIESGLLETRSDDGIEIAYDRLKDRGLLFWGMGNGYFESHFTSGLSYKNVLFNFGWLGMCFLYIPVLCAAFKIAKHNKQAILLILCFFISVYQRPHIFNPIYFLILFGGLQNLLFSAQSKIGHIDYYLK